MVLNSIRDLVTLPFRLAHALQNTIKSLNQVALSDVSMRRQDTEHNFCFDWQNNKREGIEKWPSTVIGPINKP